MAIFSQQVMLSNINISRIHVCDLHCTCTSFTCQKMCLIMCAKCVYVGFFRFDTLCMEAQIDVDKSGDMCLQGASLCVVKWSVCKQPLVLCWWTVSCWYLHLVFTRVSHQTYKLYFCNIWSQCTSSSHLLY